MLETSDTDSDELAPPIRKATGRRLTLLYIVALSTVAALSVGAQALIQRQLRNGESDSRVINIAGRQRMLSQRLAKAALRIGSASDATESSAAREELAETRALWALSHDGLLKGDPVEGLPGRPSAAVRVLFDRIEPHFAAMHDAASALIAGPPPGDDRAALVEVILANEADFLRGMDRLVTQYVTEAEHRVARLQTLESAILGCTLLVLLAEGWLVFRPAVRRISQTVSHLELVSDRLRSARDEAERADSAKSRFLANVSHELRTPMTAVLGMTELAQQSDDPATRSYYLSVVEEAGESLLAILNDLIDVARIDADQIAIREEPFDPAELVERIARLMRPAADAKGVALGVTIADGPLPRLWGDQRRLGQVLLNLVGNAVKWTDRGNVTISAAVDDGPNDQSILRLTVADTGVGIAADQQALVFDPFWQSGEPDQPSRGGAGLGLAICRRIVDAMGGRIDLQSAIGQGSTFRVECPLAIATGAITLDPVDSLVAETPGVAVLVVEDTQVNQTLLREVLQSAGHRVTICDNGESAIEAFRQESFDVIVADYQLPGINGAEMAAQMRRVAEDLGRDPTPMICVTAHAGGQAPAGIEGMFDAVVTKPLRRDALLGAIASHSRAAAPQSKNETHGVTVAPSLRRELAEAFVTAAPAQVGSLRGAIASGDLAEVRLIAHRLRGQLGYFNAPESTRQLADLEDAAEADDAERVTRLGKPAVDGVLRLVDGLR